MRHVITCPNCGAHAGSVTVAAPDMRTARVPGWLLEFVDARCVLSPDETVPVPAFRAAYEAWASEAGAPIVSKRALGAAVGLLPGVRLGRTNTTRRYDGIGLN